MALQSTRQGPTSYLTAKLTAKLHDTRGPWWTSLDSYIRPELRRRDRRRLPEQLTKQVVAQHEPHRQREFLTADARCEPGSSSSPVPQRALAVAFDGLSRQQQSACENLACAVAEHRGSAIGVDATPKLVFNSRPGYPGPYASSTSGRLRSRSAVNTSRSDSSTRRRRHEAGRLIIGSANSWPQPQVQRRQGMSVAARVDGDHFELPDDAVELLRQVRPADRQGFIEEITQALAVAAKTKDFRPLQDVLQAWMVTVRLQQQPGYEAMIQRMQRRERGLPVDLDELRRPRG